MYTNKNNGNLEYEALSLGLFRHVGDWSQRVQSIREVFKNIKGKPGVVMPGTCLVYLLLMVVLCQ